MSGSSNHITDPKKLPKPFKADANHDLEHQNQEWVSGTRGGGSVPADIKWTNPKQHQEERGAADAERPVSK